MSRSQNGFSTFFQWFAWTISLVASVFFTIYVIDEKIPGILKGHGKEWLPFVVCLFVSVVGCLISFFRQTSGALLMLFGGIGMATYLYFQGGARELNSMIVYGGPYILAAFLFLVTRRR